jgi:hypothetical protein
MADDIALHDERGIVSFPRLIVSHLHSETPEDFRYNLINLSVRELY